MRKVLLLCCVIVFASGAALAQSASGSAVSTIADAPPPAASSASAAEPQVASRLDLSNWQVGFSYQHTMFYLPQQKQGRSTVGPFTATENGYDVSFTRFLNTWGGLEGDVAQGWGGTSTSQINSSHSLFLGGGPHFALRGHGRVEPWAHILVGLEHFRFSQTATAYGSNNTVGFIGGMGVDFHLNPRTAFRISGDYVGTALFKQPQTNWQAGAGIVFNF